MTHHHANQNTTVEGGQGAIDLWGKFIRLFKMSFKDDNLEQAYQDDHYHKSIFSIRLALLFAITLYALFGILDSQIIPDAAREAWIIRYAIFCPLAFLVYFLSYFKNFRKFLRFSICFTALVAGIGIVVMIALAKPPGSDVYYVGLLLTTMFYFIFLRLNLAIASMLAWTVFIIYEFVAIWIKGSSTFILINNTFFFVAFIITGMMACYWIERSSRTGFIARKTISDQAEKLRMMFDNSPVGIFHFDADGVITASNNSFLRLLGSTAEKIIGLNMLKDLKDRDIIEAVKKCLSGERASHEGIYEPVTGTNTAMVTAIFAPIRNGMGSIEGGIGIVEDNTERHNAQEETRRSEQRYKSLYSMMRLMCDNVPDLMWAKDLDGRFLFVNRAMIEKLLGALDTDEPIGKNDMYFAQRHRAARPDDPDWFSFGEICVDSDAVIMSIKRPKKFDEFGNVRGRFLFLNVYKAPFIDHHGKMIGTVGCGRDVTRERRLEKERESAVEALAASESKFRFITESVADIVWLMNLEFKTTYVSPSIERLLGFTPEQRKQQSIEMMVTPRSLEEIQKTFAQEMLREREGGQDPDRSVIVETEFYTKDGSTKWFENNVRGIRDSNGVLTGFLGLSRDMTERKLNLERLEKLNHCLLSLGSNHHENLDKLTKLCGELLGAKWALYSSLQNGLLSTTSQWNTPEDLDSPASAKGNICQDVISQNARLLMVRNLPDSIYGMTDPKVAKYGLRTYIGSVIHRNKDPHGALCVVFQDDLEPTEDEKHIIQIIASAISSEEERELSWSQFRQRQAMERLLLEISGHFISVSTTEIDSAINESLRNVGLFCDVDRSYVFIFDYQSGTMDNTHEWCAEGITAEKENLQRIPLNMLKGWMSSLTLGDDIQIRDVSKMGEDWKNEREILESQGIKSLLVVPLIQYEDLIGFVGFDSVRDFRVWEEWQQTLLHMFADRLSAALYRKLVEDERAQLNAKLSWSQKMEAIGTLAGGIAHDFNNLLQVILGYSETLLRGKQVDDRDRLRIERISEAGRKGAELVRGLLTFSRKVEPRLASINLNNEIFQFQAFLSRTIPKTIRIELRLNADLKTILADSSQINQILMNLGLNARDAMVEGGTLTIHTDNVQLGPDYCLRHVGSKPGSYVMLAMTDSGAGIDKETLEHIFEPFFTTKGQGKGTGLGLATVYGIVKQHHGYITCYSEVGVGSTFKVYFPAIEEIPIESIDAPELLLDGKQETILVVDDEEDIRHWSRELLEGADYKVLEASNGKQAVEIYMKQRDNIALVLLDLVMPEMDGKRCLEELKRINPDIRVVVISGFSASDQTNLMMSLGAYDFVGKPYDASRLLSKIRDALESDG